MIKIEGLKKSFSKTEVLKDINLKITKGETIAIIGPSGTVKSTLLRCLNFLERPDAGKIKIGDCSIDAQKVSEKEINNLRKKTAMVFQNYSLLKNKTALQNVMEPMVVIQKIKKNEAEKIALSLLEKVGMLEKKDAYPRELSGGQQQRVGIARAMAIPAELILFDEPTSSLDPELVGEILKLISNLSHESDTAKIIVTHEMNFAKEVADRMIFLEDGIVAMSGTPKEVFNCQNVRIQKFINSLNNLMEKE